MAKGKSVLSNSSRFYAELHKIWRQACTKKMDMHQLYVKLLNKDIIFEDEDGELRKLFPDGTATQMQTFKNAFGRMRDAYVKLVEEIDDKTGKKVKVPYERQDGRYIYGEHCPPTIAGTAFPELVDTPRKGRSPKVLDTNHLLGGFDALDEDLFGDDTDEGDE